MMEQIRYSTLASAIAHALEAVNATDEERKELFRNDPRLSETVGMATSLLRSMRSGAEIMAAEMVKEATAIWGAEAGLQLAKSLETRINSEKGGEA
ncbi:MAG: hypothetical protein PGN22_02170 [Agrobacterium cavarae]